MSKVKVSSSLGNVFVTEGMTVTEDAFILPPAPVDLPTISKDIVDEPTSVTDGEDTSDSA